MMKRRIRKTNRPSILDDPNVEVWEDGRIIYHDTTKGPNEVHYQMLSGPNAPSLGKAEVESEIDWEWVTRVAVKFLAVVFIILGILAFAAMVSGHDLGCKLVAGNFSCFAVVPSAR